MDRIDRRLAALAAVLLCGAVPALMDATMVNVAVEALAADRAGTLTDAQWVVTGYLLATTVGIPLVGWGLDRFGARALWTFALALFAAGSALCGVAWSLRSLVVFRIAAGVGGGLVRPSVQAMRAAAAGPLRVGRAMLLLTVPGQFVMILGPVFGGLIIESLGWRWTFFSQAPLCAAAAVLGWWRVPSGRRNGSSRLDVVGFALLLPALVMLVHGLSSLRPEGVREVSTGAVAATAWGAPATALPPSTWVLAGVCSSSASSLTRSVAGPRRCWTCGSSPGARSPWPRRCCSSPGSPCGRRCSCCRCSTSVCSARTRWTRGCCSLPRRSGRRSEWRPQAGSRTALPRRGR